jgi:hypothetical protein
MYLDRILKPKETTINDAISVDSAEDPQMTKIRNEVFKPRGTEIIPPYLRKDLPSKKGILAKEWALRQHKYGDRPSAEGFERICKELYIKHCSSLAKKHPKTRVKSSRNSVPVSSQLQKSLREEFQYRTMFGTEDLILPRTKEFLSQTPEHAAKVVVPLV